LITAPPARLLQVAGPGNPARAGADAEGTAGPAYVLVARQPLPRHTVLGEYTGVVQRRARSLSRFTPLLIHFIPDL
jgi:hypothetical protein